MRTRVGSDHYTRVRKVAVPDRRRPARSLILWRAFGLPFGFCRLEARSDQLASFGGNLVNAAFVILTSALLGNHPTAAPCNSPGCGAPAPACSSCGSGHSFGHALRGQL